VEGHRPVYHADDVPKGFIAVRDVLYRKIEVKGKGGGGKVYKVWDARTRTHTRGIPANGSFVYSRKACKGYDASIACGV